jgi:hypothetical protein
LSMDGQFGGRTMIGIILTLLAVIALGILGKMVLGEF